MKTEHPYAEILRAIAEGEIVEMSYKDGPWETRDLADILALIGAPALCKFRIKPRTLTVTLPWPDSVGTGTYDLLVLSYNSTNTRNEALALVKQAKRDQG